MGDGEEWKEGMRGENEGRERGSKRSTRGKDYSEGKNEGKY